MLTRELGRPLIWYSAMDVLSPSHRDLIECYVTDLEEAHKNLQNYVTHVLLPSKAVTISVTPKQ